MDEVPLHLDKYGISMEDPSLVSLNLAAAIMYHRVLSGHQLPPASPVLRPDTPGQPGFRQSGRCPGRTVPLLFQPRRTGWSLSADCLRTSSWCIRHYTIEYLTAFWSGYHPASESLHRQNSGCIPSGFFWRWGFLYHAFILHPVHPGSYTHSQYTGKSGSWKTESWM